MDNTATTNSTMIPKTIKGMVIPGYEDVSGCRPDYKRMRTIHARLRYMDDDTSSDWLDVVKKKLTKLFGPERETLVNKKVIGSCYANRGDNYKIIIDQHDDYWVDFNIWIYDVDVTNNGLKPAMEMFDYLAKIANNITCTGAECDFEWHFEV